jgi:hypothetical protein
MPFEMMLWRVAGAKLEGIAKSRLDQEQRLEDWITADPSLLGMDDIAIIGRQVHTTFGGRIDLLALNSSADCVVLELKRDRTPREVVAQILEYAAWVRDLNYEELDEIAQEFCRKDLKAVFKDAFNEDIPDIVNAGHHLIVVASAMDDSSERIIDYLSEVHDLSINAVFFTVFRDDHGEHIGRAWLKDPIVTAERSEPKRTPRSELAEGIYKITQKGFEEELDKAKEWAKTQLPIVIVETLGKDGASLADMISRAAETGAGNEIAVRKKLRAWKRLGWVSL